MQIARTMKRWLLVVPAFLLMSTVTWGQGRGPRAVVGVEIGAPRVRLVVVDRRWERERWRERAWREHEWRERQWRRYHRREERREHYYRGY